MVSKPLVLWSCLLTSIAFAPQQAWAGKRAVDLIQAQTEIPDEALLDVGVRVFDPGLPKEHKALRKSEEKGVFAYVRQAEARYIPFQLAQTLQSSGFWGTVRMVPDTHIVDLAVSGTIPSSTGKELKLEIRVVDARGKVWLKKRYRGEAFYLGFYQKENRRDPYQSLYNRIANDILKAYTKLDDADVAQIRTVSGLRFAADLLPSAFPDYLRVSKKGRYAIERLLATNDSMMARVGSVRQRDQMFVDVLSEHYADFHAKMREPYDQWRERSLTHQLLTEKLGRQSLLEKIVGAGIIVGGIAAASALADDDGYDHDAGDFAAELIGETAMVVGSAVIEDGVSKGYEARMHRSSLRELGESLDSHVAPILVNVEGEVTRLTGSVEAQYRDWRKLLRRIFATETGLPLHSNVEIVKEGSASKFERR